MLSPTDAANELQKLQLEIMQKLQVIADEIHAGKLSADAGALQAKEMIASHEERRLALFNASMAAPQRSHRLAWLTAGVIVLLLVVVVTLKWIAPLHGAAA